MKDDTRAADSQQQLLLAISIYIRQHGYSPTIRELVEATGAGSTSVVTYRLEALQAAGLVDWLPGAARTIHLTKRAS